MNQISNPLVSTDQAGGNQTALNFAHADYHWRTLSEDRDHWIDPEKQRGLAFAFLRYHAAKLALISETEIETQN